jgi:dTDP-4-dehydrorhamnose reductase
MSRRLAWVTGAGGLIGRQIVLGAARYAPDWAVRGWTREQLNLLDLEAVTGAFAAYPPALVIHCAALSRGPACEADPMLAERINVDVTRHLCALARGIPFFLFSTDLVFDGQKGGYVEGDAVNPLSVYAKTKAAAEQCVLQNRRHAVIRTSLNGGASAEGVRGFNEELRRAWREGRPTRLFTDEYRSPIAAGVTARAVWEFIAREVTGLMHVAGSERLSRCEIGRLVATRCPELRPQIEPASLREYEGPPRSPDTSLNCEKAQALLSFRLPGLSEWLRQNTAEFF